MRLFIADCANLLAADPLFVPNQNIPMTPFIERLRSISVHSLLINFFVNMTPAQRRVGKIAVSKVAQELSTQVGTKVDSKQVKQLFSDLSAEKFPVKSLEIKNKQNMHYE